MTKLSIACTIAARELALFKIPMSKITFKISDVLSIVLQKVIKNECLLSSYSQGLDYQVCYSLYSANRYLLILTIPLHSSTESSQLHM